MELQEIVTHNGIKHFKSMGSGPVLAREIIYDAFSLLFKKNELKTSDIFLKKFAKRRKQSCLMFLLLACLYLVFI